MTDIGSEIANGMASREPQEDDPHSIRYGDIEATHLQTRNRCFVRVHKIAAVMIFGSATRLVFDAGGHMDICGAAEYWRAAIRLAQIQIEDREDGR